MTERTRPDTDFNLTYNNTDHLSGWQLDCLSVNRSTDALGCLTGLSIELDAAGYPKNNASFNLHYNADSHIQRVTQTNSANNNDQLIATC